MIRMPNSPVRILAPIAELNYFDVQTKTLTTHHTALEAWNLMVARPLPGLKIAYRIRNAISSLFGVPPIDDFSEERPTHISPGDSLDFSTVVHCDDTALVTLNKDRHLDVMTCITVEDHLLSITSSVMIHNFFGRIYMLPVGIAHRWIVRAMLRRMDA